MRSDEEDPWRTHTGEAGMQMHDSAISRRKRSDLFLSKKVWAGPFAQFSEEREREHKSFGDLAAGRRE